MVSVETIVVSSLNDRLGRTTIQQHKQPGITTASVQRSFSMPEIDNKNNNNTSSNLRQSRSEDLPNKPKHRLDPYGFIVNLDKHGNLISSDPEEHTNEQQQQQQQQTPRHTEQQTRLDRSEETAQTQRRIQKWNTMLNKQPGDWHPAAGSDINTNTHGSRILHRSRNNSNNKKFDILLKRRLRKGIPSHVRAPVWTRLCHVAKSIQEHPPGTYRRLVETAVHTGVQPIVEGSNNNNNNNSNLQKNPPPPVTKARSKRTNPQQRKQETNDVIHIASSLHHTKSFRNVQETIERDIHRTFPRHTLFYSRDEEDDNDQNNENGNHQSQPNGRREEYTKKENGTKGHDYQENNEDEEDNHFLEQTAMSFCGSLPSNDSKNNIGKDNSSSNNNKTTTNPTMNNSNTPTNYYRMQSGNANADDAPSPKIMLHSASGQAKLRRLLKAYSAYDHQIGYCQGMNFIAGMFLTIVQDEEQAFWMLVSVMNDPPCQMRSLFEEGMTGTHKVLFVAEQLIHQFLPRLAKHFDKEGIDVTMFATQWLLTIFTSSFRFDLVTRVWDCFLYEGWKITYRVMLSLLQHSQNKLLTMCFEEILSYFRELPEKIEAGNEIVDESFKIPLLTSHIQKYENEWQWKQQQEQQI